VTPIVPSLFVSKTSSPQEMRLRTLTFLRRYRTRSSKGNAEIAGLYIDGLDIAKLDNGGLDNDGRDNDGLMCVQ